MAKDEKELSVQVGAELQAAVDAEKASRDIIKHYVSDQLVSGVDYGIIVGNKPTLLKPGMEKIFSLLKITSRIEKDNDTWEMLGSPEGTVAYKCTLYREGSTEPFAEGRGNAKVGEKSRDANSTVKIAEKRARMDACLTMGFSEFFTQDLDDMDPSPGRSPIAPGVTPVGNHARVLGAERPATQKQIDFVRSLMKTKANVTTVGQSRAIMEQYDVEPKDVTDLNITEAKKLIDVLLQLPTAEFRASDLDPHDLYDVEPNDYDGTDKYGN